jgi:STE24 endopeptidase
MNIYLIVVLCILVADYVLDLVVELLNVRHLDPQLPQEMAEYYDAEKYARSQEYLKVNTRFGQVVSSITTPLMIAFILLGGFNLVDVFARSLGFGPIVTGLAFSGILLWGGSILQIPIGAYHTFVIEERFGFNRTSLKTFIADLLKGWLLAAVIGTPVLAAILWFFAAAGSMAWLYCWGALTLVQLVLMFVAPVLIMPLFNRYDPLEEGDLRSSIESYARSQAFKMKGVFKMDGSLRSSKSNAFFTGFGRFRRIVLFDTLMAQHTTQELTAVIAHEMGHYKKRHIIKFMFVSIATTELMFFLLSFFLDNPGLSAAFRMESTSIYAGLFFFGILYSPISSLISIAVNILSRRHEYEADRYAVDTYGDANAMVTALKKLSVDNLANLTPHPLKVFLEYSHPPVIDRIRAIETCSPAS